MHPDLGGGFGRGYPVAYGYDFIGDKGVINKDGSVTAYPDPDPRDTCDGIFFSCQPVAVEFPVTWGQYKSFEHQRGSYVSSRIKLQRLRLRMRAGHGTHVAGLVGANGAVVGMAPGVTFGALGHPAQRLRCSSALLVEP